MYSLKSITFPEIRNVSYMKPVIPSNLFTTYEIQKRYWYSCVKLWIVLTVYACCCKMFLKVSWKRTIIASRIVFTYEKIHSIGLFNDKYRVCVTPIQVRNFIYCCNTEKDKLAKFSGFLLRFVWSMWVQCKKYLKKWDYTFHWVNTSQNIIHRLMFFVCRCRASMG